jgi:hypothetical protein
MPGARKDAITQSTVLSPSPICDGYLVTQAVSVITDQQVTEGYGRVNEPVLPRNHEIAQSARGRQ